MTKPNHCQSVRRSIKGEIRSTRKRIETKGEKQGAENYLAALQNRATKVLCFR